MSNNNPHGGGGRVSEQQQQQQPSKGACHLTRLTNTMGKAVGGGRFINTTKSKQQAVVEDVDYQPTSYPTKKKKFQAAGVYRPPGGSPPGHAAAAAPPQGIPQLYSDFQQPLNQQGAAGGRGGRGAAGRPARPPPPNNTRPPMGPSGAPEDRVASMLYLKQTEDEVSAITLATFDSFEEEKYVPELEPTAEEFEEQYRMQQQLLSGAGRGNAINAAAPIQQGGGSAFLNVREPGEHLEALPNSFKPPRRAWKNQVFRPGGGGTGGGIVMEERPPSVGGGGGIAIEERPAAAAVSKQPSNKPLSPPAEPEFAMHPSKPDVLVTDVVVLDQNQQQQPKPLEHKASLLPLTEPEQEPVLQQSFKKNQQEVPWPSRSQRTGLDDEKSSRQIESSSRSYREQQQMKQQQESSRQQMESSSRSYREQPQQQQPIRSYREQQHVSINQSYREPQQNPLVMPMQSYREHPKESGQERLVASPKSRLQKTVQDSPPPLRRVSSPPSRLRRPGLPDNDNDDDYIPGITAFSRQVSEGEGKPDAPRQARQFLQSNRRLVEAQEDPRNPRIKASITPIREPSVEDSFHEAQMNAVYNDNVGGGSVESSNRNIGVPAVSSPTPKPSSYQKIDRAVFDNLSIPPVTEPVEANPSWYKFTADGIKEREQQGSHGRVTSSPSYSNTTREFISSLPREDNENQAAPNSAYLQSEPCLAYSHNDGGEPFVEVFHESAPSLRPAGMQRNHRENSAPALNASIPPIREPDEQSGDPYSHYGHSDDRHSQQQQPRSGSFMGGSVTDRSLISDDEDEDGDHSGANHTNKQPHRLPQSHRSNHSDSQRRASTGSISSVGFSTVGSGESLRIVPIEIGPGGRSRSLAGMRDSIFKSMQSLEGSKSQNSSSMLQDDNLGFREWACGDCSYINRQCDDMCAICGSKNVAEVFQSNRGGYSMQRGFTQSARTLRSSISSGTSKDTDGAWMCLTCTYMNQNAFHLSCEICGTPRSKSNEKDLKLLEEGKTEETSFHNAGEDVNLEDVLKEKVSEEEHILLLLGEQGEILNELQGMKAFKQSDDPVALTEFQEAVEAKGHRLDEIRAELQSRFQKEHKEQEMVEQVQERRRSQLLESTGVSSLDELLGGDQSDERVAQTSAEALEWMSQQRMLDEWRSQVEARSLQLEEMRLQQDEVIRAYGGHTSLDQHASF